MCKRNFSLLILLLVNAILYGQNHKVVFQITVADSATTSIFLAGSMNGWQPANANYAFQKMDNGVWKLETHLATDEYEFKLTAGSWDRVEVDIKGQDIANRKITIKKDTTIEWQVAQWKTVTATNQLLSTASAQVTILDTAFPISTLGRTRRIWVYIPINYSSSRQKYPVLYMHDGQNLFDHLSSYSGEWGVDELLDSVDKFQMIVVGIDNGGTKRLNEYSPYDHELFGKGEGDAYVDFLVKDLKPFIENNFRTDKKKSFIAGSSMGGLISYYAILKYPKEFQKAGVFSPAFWVVPQLFEDTKQATKYKRRIYFYAGGKESESMVSDMEKMIQLLSQRLQRKLKKVSIVKEEGLHNEATWRNQLPAFFKWLLQ